MRRERARVRVRVRVSMRVITCVRVRERLAQSHLPLGLRTASVAHSCFYLFACLACLSSEALQDSCRKGSISVTLLSLELL